MNTFVEGYILSGVVFAFAIGIATAIISALISVCSRKKVSLFVVFMRFVKGFVSVALIYLYIFCSMLWSPLNNQKNISVSSSLVSSVFAVIELAIPILIVIFVHKVTKRIENNHRTEK